MSDDNWYLVDNEPGLFIHAAREAKGYTMEEISRGICSLSTLSRIEIGERVVDYIMIEALLERMKIEKSEYEFVLDEDDYSQYMKREEIRKAINDNELKKAEQKLTAYEKKHGKDSLHSQFIYFQRALLEEKKEQLDKSVIKKLFEKAISVTAPEYMKFIEKKEILSDTELFCFIGIFNCIEDSVEREKAYKKLYDYFGWCRIREKMFPVPYRKALYYYASCLYENKKYKACIDICNEVLEELFTTSKLENRYKIFELRAKAKEQLGFETEEQKQQCIKDFLTAYYVAEFYKEEETAQKIKTHVKEVYGWQFTE